MIGRRVETARRFAAVCDSGTSAEVGVRHKKAGDGLKVWRHWDDLISDHLFIPYPQEH